MELGWLEKCQALKLKGLEDERVNHGKRLSIGPPYNVNKKSRLRGSPTCLDAFMTLWLFLFEPAASCVCYSMAPIQFEFLNYKLLSNGAN